MDTLLLEIGSEEIPAGYIAPALEALASRLSHRLAEARIEHGALRTYGTPRRLAVIVDQVAPRQQSMKTELIGPPAAIGFDQQGRPTMAARKFAEKAGVAVEKLRTAHTAKGDYLAADKIERAQPTRTLLREILPEVILSIPFPKKMHWADLDIEFARPIFSIAALLGNAVIAFQLGNLKSGRTTRGHYFMSPGRLKILRSEEYGDILKAANVLVDISERKKVLQREIAGVAQKLGGRILPDPELEDINTNLVEYPVAVAGNFDEGFLEVPDEVLINSMREHQKYFAVVDDQNHLMPCFISVNNTRARDMALVARGHERVIRARLADAQFFYRGDLEVSNDQRVEQLKGVLFQAQLGTMYAKTERVSALASYLAQAAGAGRPDFSDLERHAKRAAHLCKSDLVSHVVGEFPKLQGVMGRVYAALAGEPAEVAAAIEEHYRPVYSGAPLPETVTGALVAIADKIDSICGCFSVGLVPTGASDPYALRRQGIGIVQIMLDKGFSFSLSALIEKSLSLFEKKSNRELGDLTAGVLSFIKNRMAHLLAEEGFSKDVIAAVIDISGDNVPDIWNRVRALEALKAQPDFEPLAAAFKRVGNIIRKAGTADRGSHKVDAALFEHDSEGALFAAFQAVETKAVAAVDRGRFDLALREIATLRASVDDFFDGVMVMSDKKRLRENRLALLGGIAGLFEKFADFSKIST
ncbi:MAG: glycine--tRNA ligase subunit beta [Desulfobacterales bacterium]